MSEFILKMSNPITQVLHVRISSKHLKDKRAVCGATPGLEFVVALYSYLGKIPPRRASHLMPYVWCARCLEKLREGIERMMQDE